MGYEYEDLQSSSTQRYWIQWVDESCDLIEVGTRRQELWNALYGLGGYVDSRYHMGDSLWNDKTQHRMVNVITGALLAATADMPGGGFYDFDEFERHAKQMAERIAELHNYASEQAAETDAVVRAEAIIENGPQR